MSQESLDEASGSGLHVGLQRAIAIRSSEDVSGLGAPLVPLQSPGLALNAAVAADVGQGIGKHTDLPLNPDVLSMPVLGP